MKWMLTNVFKNRSKVITTEPENANKIKIILAIRTTEQ